MPRFYFDLFLGSASNRDGVGYEIASLHVAEIEAMRSAAELAIHSAAELARDRLRKVQGATPDDIRIEVKDEHRQPVLTVTLSIRVERARADATVRPVTINHVCRST